MRAQRLCRFLVFVGGQVIQYDHGAGFDLWHQHLAHVGGKCRAVHCALYDPWGDQGFMGQPCDQRLRSPTAKWRIHGQSLAAQGSASQAGEIGFDSCFVNKDNTIRSPPNRWQPMGKPIGALVPYLGTTAL